MKKNHRVTERTEDGRTEDCGNPLSIGEEPKKSKILFQLILRSSLLPPKIVPFTGASPVGW